MSSARIGGWVLAGLIVCLTIAVLLLGAELALALGALERLSTMGTAALVGAAFALYGAIAWRGAQEGGGGLLLAWWGTMVGAHLGLGLLVGLLRAALTASPLSAGEAASWAGGVCLPLGVLQVGYAVGVAAVAYGKGDATVIEGAPVGKAPEPPTAPLPEKPAPEVARPAHLEVYATAIGKLRAADHASLLRFAAQAAHCKGGVLATRTGELVACVEVDGLDATRVATVLPKLVDDVETLAAPTRPATTMLHAAFAGYEVLAMAGSRFIGCLVGPQTTSRQTAEVVLPALVARAEALPVERPGPPKSPEEA